MAEALDELAKVDVPDRISASSNVSDLERIVKISYILTQDDPLLEERIEAALERLGPNSIYDWAKMTKMLSA